MFKPLAIAAAMLSLPGAVNAVAFTNGSFELTGAANPFQTLSAGDSTTITGWTVGGSGVDYIGDYWVAADGTSSVDLSAIEAGSISQTFDTVSGATYRVGFALAGNGEGAPTTKTLSVIATGGSLATYTFDTTGATRANMNRSQRTYSFVASGTSTTLTFASLNNTSFGPAIDNVSVAIPEPTTWALMIVGFAMVGAAVRRRRLVSRLA